MIENDDLIKLRELGEVNGDVLALAEKMGYIVDRDFVIELIVNHVNIRRAFKTSSSMKLVPYDAKKRDLRKTLKNKIEKLYGDDPFQLMAISNYYKGKTPNVIETKSYKKKMYQLPESYVKIIKGTGIYKCTSLKKIKEFELTEEDEIVRRKFKLSGEDSTG